MKLLEATGLALRILGIYILIKIVGWIPIYVGGGAEYPYKELHLMTYLLWAIAGVIFIRYPIYIANKLVIQPLQNSEIINYEGKSLQITAFVVIGVYILSWAIPDFIYNFFTIYQARNTDMYTKNVVVQLVTLIEIGIALYLILGARKLCVLIRRFGPIIDE